MGGCSILGCNKRSERREDVSFHLFPSDPVVRKIWIEATGRRNWLPSKYAKVCSSHFEANCMIIMEKLAYLKSSSVPTLSINNINENISPPVKQEEMKLLEQGDDKNESDERFNYVETDSQAGPSNVQTTLPATEIKPKVYSSEGNYGQCRCCLKTGYHSTDWEVNFENLKECLNLIMQTDPSLSQLVCSSCVSFVKSAQTFRTMVIESENQLLSVKSEVVSPKVSVDCDYLVTVKSELCEDEPEMEFLYDEVFPPPNNVPEYNQTNCDYLKKGSTEKIHNDFGKMESVPMNGSNSEDVLMSQEKMTIISEEYKTDQDYLKIGSAKEKSVCDPLEILTSEITIKSEEDSDEENEIEHFIEDKKEDREKREKSLNPNSLKPQTIIEGSSSEENQWQQLISKKVLSRKRKSPTETENLLEYRKNLEEKWKIVLKKKN